MVAMASSHNSDDDDDDDNIGLDDEFFRQMEALKQACQLRDQNDATEGDGSGSSSAESDDSDDEVLRSIQKKFNAVSTTDPPGLQASGQDTDEEEDEDSILRSVQKFCGIESVDHHIESQAIEQAAPQCGTFFTALNQNRSCQRLLRSLLHQVKLKKAENDALQKRVKSSIRFERNCKKRAAGLFTGKLSNPVVTFMANLKRRVVKKPYEAPADAPAMAPPENPDVAKFRILRGPLATLVEKKWTAEQKAELGKGVRQQIQESHVRQVLESMGSQGRQDARGLDAEIRRIGKEGLSAEDIHDGLPAVDWAHVSRTYVIGRSPQECKLQWLNYEDPSINKRPWAKLEDKKLLKIAQEHNCRHWDIIARELGTNRPPAQCLARYQRSLNASILRSSWTEEEDQRLRSIVERLGENDWQSVAATLDGRTGSQCSNRWYKVLHPTIHRKGRWGLDEDKRLKWAVSVYGPQKWRVIASHVPGRTDIQCRERWVNVLDPSVNISPWTPEEDELLVKLVDLHGQHKWSKVAKGMDRRTDSQCWRRWKNLHPENQASFHLDNQIKKAALPSNWVGRVKERPKLGVQDFIPDDTHLKAPKRQSAQPRKNVAASSSEKNLIAGDQVGKKTKTRKVAKNRSAAAPVNSPAVEEFVGLVRMFDSFCRYADKLNPGPEAPPNPDIQLGTELQGSSGDEIELTSNTGVGTDEARGGDGAADVVGHDKDVPASDTMDAQVAAATRAILSWPFAVGMMGLCADTRKAIANMKQSRRPARNKDTGPLTTTLQESHIASRFGKRQSKIVVVPASSREENTDKIVVVPASSPEEESSDEIVVVPASSSPEGGSDKIVVVVPAGSPEESRDGVPDTEIAPTRVEPSGTGDVRSSRPRRPQQKSTNGSLKEGPKRRRTPERTELPSETTGAVGRYRRRKKVQDEEADKVL